MSYRRNITWAWVWGIGWEQTIIKGALHIYRVNSAKELFLHWYNNITLMTPRKLAVLIATANLTTSWPPNNRDDPSTPNCCIWGSLKFAPIVNFNPTLFLSQWVNCQYTHYTPTTSAHLLVNELWFKVTAIMY